MMYRPIVRSEKPVTGGDYLEESEPRIIATMGNFFDERRPQKRPADIRCTRCGGLFRPHLILHQPGTSKWECLKCCGLKKG